MVSIPLAYAIRRIRTRGMERICAANDRYVPIKFSQNLVSAHARDREEKFWPPGTPISVKRHCHALRMARDTQREQLAPNKYLPAMRNTRSSVERHTQHDLKVAI